MITINVAPPWLYIISYPARPRRIIFKYLTIITRDDLISNKRDWNNYFINNAPKTLGKSSRFYFLRRNWMLQCTDNFEMSQLALLCFDQLRCLNCQNKVLKFLPWNIFMPYFVAFSMLPGVAFCNSSMTSFSFNSGAKRFPPAAIVSWGKIF